MKSKTREQAIRLFLSSLVNSDLSVREIRDISEALLCDRDFSENLGRALKNLAVSLEGFMDLRELKPSDEYFIFPQNSIDEALSLIRKKRIPKKNIIAMIRALSPEWVHFPSDYRSLNVRELLDAFFHSASDRTANDFLNWLHEGSLPDDYLKGIMRKR